MIVRNFFSCKDYGLLFYNENNKSSHDNNHAILYADKLGDLDTILEEIKSVYTKGLSLGNLKNGMSELQPRYFYPTTRNTPLMLSRNL